LPSSRSDLIIAIPCFQGERTIGQVVRGALGAGLPVVVVDDGSTDGSGEAAEAAGATLLRHPRNRGKGAALQTAFAWAERAGARAVLTMDADGQHDPAEIPRLVEAHRDHPRAVVVGVRSFAPEDMPRRSRIGNRISTWWISKFAGRPHADTQSGFRVYPRALYAAAPLASTRFETETELLLWAAKMELPLVEVPIATIYGPDRVTHFHGFRDTLRVIKLVIRSPWWPRVGAAE
jgi:glycosyltransferase involved in cell wall biosynthesis